MPGRSLPLRDPITLKLDGDDVVAERGEPVAAALIAAGKLAIARSPKFHRPRGPACFRAACDGCLARVDDVPNVMTCRVAAEDGMDIKTQNTLGSREVDLLRMTDWFFPKGMNHHELFAGVPGVQRIMQTFARRVAGLGRLPAEIEAPRAAARREVDVLIVGAGPAGMTVAARVAKAGRQVEVIDDALAPGGGMRALMGEDAAPWKPFDAAFDVETRRGAITVRSATTAAALFGDDLLVVGPAGAEVLTARALVLATGAHDGALAFEGNDAPGVLSARAAGWLLARGILLGKKVAVVIPPGDGGAFGEAFARAASHSEGRCEATVVRGVPLEAEGSAGVKGLTVDTGAGPSKAVRLKVDAVVIDAPRAPAYELCEQAGAEVDYTPRGFVPRLVKGKIRDGVWAAGEVTGIAFDPRAIEASAAEVARQIVG